MDRIFTYLFFAVAGIAVLAVGRQLFEDDAAGQPAAVDGARIQAHELAVSGIDYALIKLQEDPSWASGAQASAEHIPGVRIEAAAADEMGADVPGVLLENARFVTVRSEVDGAEVTVQAIIENAGQPALPRPLNYALFSGGDLDVNQQLLVRDEDNRLINANVHTNQRMTIGSRSLVQGFGTYSGLLRLRQGGSGDVFVPNYANGGKTVYRHPSIAPPEIDIRHWEKVATQTYASSTILTGDLHLGSAGQPGIWLIKGHLDLRARIKGTGVVLVTGDLRLYGKSAQDLVNEAGEDLLIVVAGNVYAEDAHISASIVSGGSFFGSGHVLLIGSLVTHGAVRNNGTLDLYYRPVSSSLAGRIWSPSRQPPRIVRLFDASREHAGADLVAGL